MKLYPLTMCYLQERTQKCTKLFFNHYLIQMNIINLGILAHIDAGKTSVTENLLFASGATEKCGRVDNGDTITDSMDIEKRRGITVRASTTSIIWNGGEMQYH